MMIQYTPKGVCARQILLAVEDGVITSANIVGGCHGNLQGIARLIEGMKVEDVIARVEGIRCGMKSTSCPDQIAQALKKAMEAK